MKSLFVRLFMQKILKNLIECDMAICDLSSRNPNVMYELGIRQAYGKKVVLIQDDATDRIFDVAGINTVFYKKDRLYENVIKAKGDITNAIKETYENDSYSLLDIAGLKDNQQSKNNDIQVSNRVLADIMISQCKDIDKLINGTRDVDLLLEYYKKIATIVGKGEENKTITPEERIMLKNALSKINDRMGELRYNN